MLVQQDLQVLMARLVKVALLALMDHQGQLVLLASLALLEKQDQLALRVIPSSVAARKDDAPAAVQAAIANVVGLSSASGSGGLIQTTSV